MPEFEKFAGRELLKKLALSVSKMVRILRFVGIIHSATFK